MNYFPVLAFILNGGVLGIGINLYRDPHCTSTIATGQDVIPGLCLFGPGPSLGRVESLSLTDVRSATDIYAYFYDQWADVPGWACGRRLMALKDVNEQCISVTDPAMNITGAILSFDAGNFDIPVPTELELLSSYA
ncbi:hypothetical protein OHC33_005582 [Knufia fluminis]|uniref:Uncharacterized protein n=1 Tax=Knufia fluminis TaxID=191047 RepID=A0AAN8EWD0_9EURO|nr:hypothetical protein OHC33_005582 [Knufia fluminis]